LILAAVCLTGLRYAGDSFATFFPHWANAENAALYKLFWWSACCHFFYAITPGTFLILQGDNPLKFGGSTVGLAKHAPLYVGMFLVMLPVVVAASYTTTFQHAYPFHPYAGKSWFDFLTWEAAYAVQFITLEFFFRGFLLFSLRPAFGSNAIFVMMVPYCMIHFQKPLPETLGAIGAGIILGTLALRTRSIWLGAGLHIAVAWTMDVLALLHRGEFPPG